MSDLESKIEKMDVSCVGENLPLAISANVRGIECCKRAAKEYGALVPPVVGKLPGGRRFVIFGGCEFAALRESGAREMDAVAVDIENEGDGAKVALMLAATRNSADALCDGMLIRQAVDGGATQAQISAAIGKSPAWVSKRLALVTRLAVGVREMVQKRVLEPGSAQEIARLPESEQCELATKVVRDGLPKSAVERLVSGYMSETCPDAVKRHIVSDPAGAAQRFQRNGMAQTQRPSPDAAPNMPRIIDIARLRGSGISEKIAAVSLTMAVLYAGVYAAPESAAPHRKRLAELAGEINALQKAIQAAISPGKFDKEVHNAH